MLNEVQERDRRAQKSPEKGRHDLASPSLPLPHRSSHLPAIDPSILKYGFSVTELTNSPSKSSLSPAALTYIHSGT